MDLLVIVILKIFPEFFQPIESGNYELLVLIGVALSLE